MPVFFIQSHSIHDNQITLTGELAHHLRDVLRCRPGEILDLVDEKKTRYRVSLDRITKQQIRADILAKNDSLSQPILKVTLAQAVLKGDKMDWVTQKATELGVNMLLPVVTERTTVRPRAERESHQRDRWQKIAKESAQQCGRLDIPTVLSVTALDGLLKKPPEASLKLVLWEAEQKQPLKSALHGLPKARSVMILVGPEGGFSPHEIEKAREAGWTPVSLGPRILRAETAGLAVLAILQYESDNGGR